MAANLYQNIMAFHGVLPWHGLGVHFDEPMTGEQALEAAKLNFTVTKEPCYRRMGILDADGKPVFEKVDEKFYTVNGDTNEVLAVVGPKYEALQNRTACGFFDVLLAESGAKYETAGALGKGERIWLLAKMPQSFEPLLGDKVDCYCLLSNTHDGTRAVEIRFTPIRVVCQNTLTAALEGCREVVKLQHVGDIQARLEESARVLRSMNDYFAKKAEVFAELASFKITDEWLGEYFDRVFGACPVGEKVNPLVQKNWAAKRELVMTNTKMGLGVDIPGVANTAWGAYNAAIEFVDYQLPMRESTSRTEVVLWGRGRAMKQDAMDAALALVRR